MLTVLSALVSLFSTSGVGAIVGALGGLANRWMDYQDKKLEYLDRDKQRSHELAVLGKEIEGRVQVAVIDGEARVEASAYSALAESYKNDRATYGIRKIDFLRGLVRPVITAVFLFIVCYINYRVWVLLDGSGVTLTPEQIFEIIRWTLFEASVVIGWWFAMRPSGQAGLRIGKSFQQEGR